MTVDRRKGRGRVIGRRAIGRAGAERRDDLVGRLSVDEGKKGGEREVAHF